MKNQSPINNSNGVFITGPSGSGKSTTARLVAENWPRPCALLDFDHIRTLVKSGYAEPSHGWNDACERQWAMAREVVGRMADTYVKHKVDVVIEAFMTPGNDYQRWRQALEEVNIRPVVLLPSLETVIARNAQREGAARLQEHDVRNNHAFSLVWKETAGVTVINNSTLSPETVAQFVLNMAFPPD